MRHTMATPPGHKLRHNDSDESLYLDLQQVITAPKNLVSKTIGSRPKCDRTEIKRILGHLPVIREARHQRMALSGGATGSDFMAGIPPRSASYTPRASAVLATQAMITPGFEAQLSQVGERMATPRMATPRRSPTPRMGTPRAATPRAATPRLSTPRRTPPGGDETPVVRTPQGEMMALVPESPPVAATPPRTASSKSSAEKDGQANVTARYLEQLAEVGIDPEGMTAKDIMQVFYARSSNTTYKIMNREADKRIHIRLSTPQSFNTVLSGRALDEVRRARDLPVTSVHECLDKWEIDTLADVCRSVKHFDEEQRGATSEYMRHYVKRSYGGVSDRKKYVRPPTP